MKRSRRADQTSHIEGDASRDSSESDQDPEALAGHRHTNKTPMPGEKDKFGNDRLTHNLAEKRRSERIREQVQNLEEILKQAGKQSKKDRTSILASTASYIKELEESLASLRESNTDAITRTQQSVMKTNTLGIPQNNNNGRVDYRSLFFTEGLPKAVASLSGKFLNCNAMFSWLTGYPKEKVLSLSFFDLTPEWEISQTQAMVGELLSLCQNERTYNGCCSKSFRKECIFNGRVELVHITLSLVCEELGSPKYFACTVLPLIHADSRGQSVFCLDTDGKSRNTKAVSAGTSTDCSLSFTQTESFPKMSQHSQVEDTGLQGYESHLSSIHAPEEDSAHARTSSIGAYSDTNDFSLPVTGMDQMASDSFGTPWSLPSPEDYTFLSSAYY